MGNTPAAPLSSPGNLANAGECDAAAVQFAVGETATLAMIETIKARSRASIVRVLREGEATTREFVAGRVNIQLDANGRIADIRCG